ncbi:probable transposable element [Lasallia pustulata]|uniref:Probable transposable element n=1 Tax=Lasallia pustulata TaxID=136370 RepID=A0A1W5CYH9_9LECA|nr:probable transposable element [Lasallia pustulata]
MDNIAEWPTVLPRLQAASNNAYRISTRQTPNKILYGFRPKEALDLLQTTVSSDNHGPTIVEAHPTSKESAEGKRASERARLREVQKTDLLPTMSSYRPSHIDAKDAIAWAALQSKHYYNANHHPRFFSIGDKVLLRLHCGYKLPGIVNQKIEQQFVGPFTVTEQIGRLAYRLDLPLNWLIHNVISITHLEPAHTNDPYNRPQPDHPPTVTVKGATTDDNYEIERLLQKQTSC